MPRPSLWNKTAGMRRIGTCAARGIRPGILPRLWLLLVGLLRQPPAVVRPTRALVSALSSGGPHTLALRRCAAVAIEQLTHCARRPCPTPETCAPPPLRSVRDQDGGRRGRSPRASRSPPRAQRRRVCSLPLHVGGIFMHGHDAVPLCRSLARSSNSTSSRPTLSPNSSSCHPASRARGTTCAPTPPAPRIKSRSGRQRHCGMIRRSRSRRSSTPVRTSAIRRGERRQRLRGTWTPRRRTRRRLGHDFVGLR